MLLPAGDSYGRLTVLATTIEITAMIALGTM